MIRAAHAPDSGPGKVLPANPAVDMLVSASLGKAWRAAKEIVALESMEGMGPIVPADRTQQPAT